MKALGKVINEDTLNKVIEAGCIDEGGKLVSLDKLSILIDKYKFMPWTKDTIKKKYEAAVFGEDKFFLGRRNKPILNKMEEHYQFLRDKLNEKFTKTVDALKFFDRNHVNLPNNSKQYQFSLIL